MHETYNDQLKKNQITTFKDADRVEINIPTHAFFV